MHEIIAMNAPQAYVEGLWRFRQSGIEQKSRAGDVITLRDPVYLRILNPDERVLFDPIRDANPFFHLMEAIWMFSGSNNVNWIAQFNKGYRKYADGDIVHGAYGHRWINHFGHVDQIVSIIDKLKRDPLDRRAVIGMWDPSVDLDDHNDLPCNTHIYFRVDSDDGLNMQVCNRSNDFIWGMLGANVVHMTMLQELISEGIGVPMGEYRVFSNNCHIYKGLDRFDKIYSTTVAQDYYRTNTSVDSIPLIHGAEVVGDFLFDCHDFVFHPAPVFRTRWMQTVGDPVRNYWFERSYKTLNDIQAGDWRQACLEWVERRSSYSTSTGR